MCERAAATGKTVMVSYQRHEQALYRWMRAFMAGDRFTMADIPIGCELHRWFGLPPDLYGRPAWPNLERYFAALQQRPAARGVLDLALE